MPATRDRSAAHGEPAGGGPVAQALPSGVGGSERQRDRPGGKRIVPGTRIICGLPALLPESGGGPAPSAALLRTGRGLLSEARSADWVGAPLPGGRGP